MQTDNHISTPDAIIAIADALPEKPQDEIRNSLISLINELINADFNALIQLLYRIDIDENKLKQQLKTHKNADAAAVIAELIIDRQLQKKAAKKQFGSGSGSGHADSR